LAGVVRVRSATAEDLPFIVEANRALAEESEGLALNVDTLRAGILALVESRAPGRYWIAEIDGRRVGQLLITYEWSDWRNRMVWWVQSVYVLPADRRHGVFRALYAHVRSEARAAGAGGLRLYVDTSNARAQAVYAAVGMRGEHYRVFEDMFAQLPSVSRGQPD
jgi:GNAT superfamily N-acetyltransferase